MLVSRFNALRERLDALKAGRGPSVGLLGRARSLLGSKDDHSSALGSLRELDADLSRAGIHTTADARLLRELGQTKGRAAELSRGLVERAETSLANFERVVTEAERDLALGKAAPGTLSALEADFTRLARIVKVAAVFATAPNAAVPFEIIDDSTQTTLPPKSARLAVAEFYADRAKRAVHDSAQGRRDLDLAAELVLRMSSDASQERDRLRKLRIDVTAAKDRAKSSPAVRSLDDLVRHLKHTARRDPRTTYRSLRALYDRAVEAKDAAVAKIASEALEALSPASEQSKAVERDEARRLSGWRLGAAFDGGEQLDPGGKRALEDSIDDVLTQLAFDLDDDQQKALELAAGSARFFDIEDSLSEELVEAELSSTRPVQRRVSYPTQAMTYEYTSSLDEVHNFVVTYPGTVLLDLAAGRQMVRSYLEEEPPPKQRKVKKTAVRVYVLDASGSMYGARARFRDAILIAELNAVRIKAKVGLPFDPLYFTYFNVTPTELTRVDSAEEARAHIERLFTQSPAEGQTDISLALMQAFSSIGKAQGQDPYLARATVVLVTDGEDGVDLELIRKARTPFAGLDIDLSFISLGEENADLKSVVLEQRREGSRAFYHHLTDAEILLARTEFDSAFRTLLPRDAAVGADSLERLLPHLEALEAIAAGRPVSNANSAAQFDTLFPPEAPVGRSRRDAAQTARLLDVLEAIAEAAPLASVDRRSLEAIELLTHLLRLYGVPFTKYLEALGDPVLHRAVLQVRVLCKPFD